MRPRLVSRRGAPAAVTRPVAGLPLSPLPRHIVVVRHAHGGEGGDEERLQPFALHRLDEVVVLHVELVDARHDPFDNWQGALVRGLRTHAMTPKNMTASITLAELTDGYTKHLEDAGKSRGAVFSYESELCLARKGLGADLSIGAITRDDIERFNACDSVMKLNGKPNAAPSFVKTQRVLRLALA